MDQRFGRSRTPDIVTSIQRLNFVSRPVLYWVEGGGGGRGGSGGGGGVH